MLPVTYNININIHIMNDIDGSTKTDMINGADARILSAEVSMDCGNFRPDLLN